MISCQTTVKSPIAIGRAFDYLTDLEQMPDWHPSVVGAARQSGRPELRNSRYLLRTRIGPGELATEAEVTELDRPHTFSYSATTRLTRSTHLVELFSTGAGVEIRTTSNFRLVPPLAILSPLAGPYLRFFCQRAAKSLHAALGEQVAEGPVWVPGIAGDAQATRS